MNKNNYLIILKARHFFLNSNEFNTYSRLFSLPIKPCLFRFFPTQLPTKTCFKFYNNSSNVEISFLSATKIGTYLYSFYLTPLEIFSIFFYNFLDIPNFN